MKWRADSDNPNTLINSDHDESNSETIFILRYISYQKEVTSSSLTLNLLAASHLNSRPIMLPTCQGHDPHSALRYWKSGRENVSYAVIAMTCQNDDRRSRGVLRLALTLPLKWWGEQKNTTDTITEWNLSAAVPPILFISCVKWKYRLLFGPSIFSYWSNLIRKCRRIKLVRMDIYHSALFRWECKLAMVTNSYTNKEGDLTAWEGLWKRCFQWSKASCLVLFTCFQWIMYLGWFMVRHAQPRPSPSMWNPAWIFHREPTGKTKIAQFKEVIKTVRNQYLSLEGPWWGFSDLPSPHQCPMSSPMSPCSSHWQLFTSVKQTRDRSKLFPLRTEMTCVENNQMTLICSPAQNMLSKFSRSIEWVAHPTCSSSCNYCNNYIAS